MGGGHYDAKLGQEVEENIKAHFRVHAPNPTDGHGVRIYYFKQV